MHGEHCGNTACLGCSKSTDGLTAVGQDIVAFSLHIYTCHRITEFIRLGEISGALWFSVAQGRVFYEIKASISGLHPILFCKSKGEHCVNS